MYLDYYYFVLIVPVLIISLIAQSRVNSAYKRFSMVQNMRGLTGAQAAQAVLQYYGVQGVRIEHIHGRLNDHYDPRDNVIRLSDGVYGSCSVAAIGIACHEAGHAAQHAENYVPIRFRNALLQCGASACNYRDFLGLSAFDEFRYFPVCGGDALSACDPARGIQRKPSGTQCN